MNTFNEKVISVRPNSSIPASLQKKVDLILLNKQSLDWTIFGSSMYRIQKYYGDIDVRETFTSNKSIEDITKKVASSLQKMVKEINKRQLTYYSEIKAGIDVRYTINIGTLDNGVYTPSKSFLVLIDEYKNIGLFNEEEYSILVDNLFDSNLDANNYDIVYNIVRERRILRWTDSEVLSGFKVLPLGIKIPLQKACGMKSFVKIDYITVLNGNFIEVTNIMFLGKKNKDGSISLINVSDEYPEPYVYVRQMRDEIEALFYSDYYRSPFKGSKRIYALARSFYISSGLVNNQDKKSKYANYIDRVLPIIKGDISQLYQAKSFLSSLSRLLKLGYDVPKDVINNQLEMLQFSLPNILILPNSLLDSINMVFSLIKKEKIDRKKILCDIIIDIFSTWINVRTIIEINKVGLDPVPNEFLPINKSYNISKLDPVESVNGIYELVISEEEGYTYIFDNNFDLLFKTKLSPAKPLDNSQPFPEVDDTFDDHEHDNFKEPTFNKFLIRNVDTLDNKEVFNKINYLRNIQIKNEISSVDIDSRADREYDRYLLRYDEYSGEDEIELPDDFPEGEDDFPEGEDDFPEGEDDYDIIKKRSTPKSKIINKIKKNCQKGNYDAIYKMIKK